VDSHEKTRELRAVLLRGQRVEVDSAYILDEAMVFWKTAMYNLVLLAPRDCPQEVAAFSQMIRQEKPGQKVVFLVGAPSALSFTVA